MSPKNTVKFELPTKWSASLVKTSHAHLLLTLGGLYMDSAKMSLSLFLSTCEALCCTRLLNTTPKINPLLHI